MEWGLSGMSTDGKLQALIYFLTHPMRLFFGAAICFAASSIFLLEKYYQIDFLLFDDIKK